MVRRFSAVAVLLLAPALAPALDGVPSSFWFAGGAPAEENAYIFSAEAGGGWGASYAGGMAERSMKAGKYFDIPLTLRYGFIRGWEIYGVLPYFWGSSSQEFTNSQVLGPPETYKSTLSGGDFGDMATGVKWAFWESEERESFLCAHLGGRFATGTDPWQYSQYNFVTGPNPPRIFHGDAAGGGVMAGLQFVSTASFPLMDITLGYIYNIPFRATAMEPYGSTIRVTPPSPLIFRGRISGVISGSWWAGLDVEGYRTFGGGISDTGYLADEPGALEKVVDSYANLIANSGGLWLGASTGVSIAPEAAVSLGFKAPVAVSGGYRYWRAELGLVYSAPLFR